MLKSKLIVIEDGKWTLNSRSQMIAPKRSRLLLEPLLLHVALLERFMKTRFTGQKPRGGDFFVRFMAMSRATFEKMQARQLDLTNQLNELRTDPSEKNDTIGIFGGFSLDLVDLFQKTKADPD